MAILPEIIYKGEIRIKNPSELFGEYLVTDKDLILYEKLVNEGKEEEAIDLFVQKYMIDYIELYNTTIQRGMKAAEVGQLEKKEFNKLLIGVVGLSAGLTVLLNQNFEVFIKNVIAPAVYKQLGITSPAVKNIIIEATLGQFKTLTTGAMAETQENILNGIRQMQREMITKNVILDKLDLSSSAMSNEIKLFKEGLRSKYPDYYKSMEEGSLLKSRRLSTTGQPINYKLENYADMSVRTTLLNVDRTANEVIAGINENKIVEYYQRDHRKLKTGIEREICKSILGKKIAGKSLLAMDAETGARLGIMTLEEATSSKRGAMGPHCRHSIRQVSKTFANKINKQVKG